MSEPPSGAPGPGPRAIDVWLAQEDLPQSERLDRLAGDADLVDALRGHGFEGADWDFFANELAKYGIAVIAAWLRQGVMAAKCTQKGIRVPSLPERVREDDELIDDLATETVAEALIHFRDDVLIPGVWDPAKGAALKTFFIGQCMKRYSNIAAAWLRLDARTPRQFATDDRAVLDSGAVLGVEDDAIRSVTAQRILEGASNARVARALAMDACGYTNAQIAADLGTSADAVSSLLKRARADIRRKQKGTG